MVPGTKRLFDACDADTLQRVRQSIFKKNNQVVGALGQNGFEVGHTRIATSQKTGELIFSAAAAAVPTDKDEAYRKAQKW